MPDHSPRTIHGAGTGVVCVAGPAAARAGVDDLGEQLGVHSVAAESKGKAKDRGCC
jgi:hypothetical protein